MAAMTVLVTGGTGLVGKGIQEIIEQEKVCSEQWVFVGSNDADLTSYDSTSKLFDDVKPTHVLHLAARVGGLYYNSTDNVGFWRDNIAMQDNINVLCKDKKILKLVSCLSTCIFPDNITYPIDEGQLHNGLPHPAMEGYGFAKRMIDVQNRLYNTQYGCNFTSVIPTNVYGKHDNFNLYRGHVIPCLIHKCYLAKRDGIDFEVLGSGRPLRQFIYSKDLGRLMIWAVKEYPETSPVILSAWEELSIGEIAVAIAKAFDFSGHVVFDTSRDDGQFRKTVSNKKLKSYLPDFKFTPLSQALEETVHWFQDHFDNARK